MLTIFTGNNSLPSDLKNPFKKDCITNIRLSYSKVLFENYFTWRGSINFKKGNTEGTQNFENLDFENIVRDMKSFVEGL